MANFENSKTHGINQRAMAAGVFPERFFGQSVFGALGPQRANTDYDYDLEEEVEGWAACLTEVYDWPYEEDDAGVEFDQENLYGVRCRCYRRPLAEGGGDIIDEKLIAVPKSVPSGYTETGRCGILVPLIADHFGEDPLLAPSWWSLRQATKIIPDISTADGQARAGWVPMNQGSRVDDSNSWSGSFFNLYNNSSSTEFKYCIGALLSSAHIGWRKATLKFYAGDGATSGSDTWYVGYRDSDDPVAHLGGSSYDATDYYDVVETFSISYTSSDFNAEKTHDITNLLAKTTGKTSTFMVWSETGLYDDEEGLIESYDQHSTTKGHVLSPRTDVPLWYFASMGNRCAPGGIIVPSAGW